MQRLISAVFACILVTGAAYGQHDHSMMSPPPAPASPAVSEHDRVFADAMSKHHEDGIKMADLASRNAGSAELRAMAAKMITGQRHDLSQLQHLRGEGTMTSMDAMLHAPGMMSESEMKADMDRLEAASGKDFDRIFTEVMPKHHAAAIRMSEHYLTVASNEGLKTLARQIMEKQSREREQLIAMRRERRETMASAGREPATPAREETTAAQEETTTPAQEPASAQEQTAGAPAEATPAQSETDSRRRMRKD